MDNDYEMFENAQYQDGDDEPVYEEEGTSYFGMNEEEGTSYFGMNEEEKPAIPLAAVTAAVPALGTLLGGLNLAKSTFGQQTITTAKKEESAISSIGGIVCLAAAMYLAIKCKKNGQIDPIQLLLAFFLTPCYIAYRVVKPCN